jgi:hypothetical protein
VACVQFFLAKALSLCQEAQMPKGPSNPTHSPQQGAQANQPPHVKGFKRASELNVHAIALAEFLTLLRRKS